MDRVARLPTLKKKPRKNSSKSRSNEKSKITLKKIQIIPFK
jgi:hypothetical protein